MVILLTIIHVLVSLFLVVVVLLQSGKAADLAGAFGGMGSQTVFGPRGSATVLTRATTVSAIVFMMTSLGLALLSTRAGAVGDTDVLKRLAEPPAGTSQAPATPADPSKQIQVVPQGGPAGAAPIPVQITPEPATPQQK